MPDTENTTFLKRNGPLLRGTVLFWLALVTIYVTAAIVDASRSGREYSEWDILKDFTAGLGQWLLLSPLVFRFFASARFLDAGYGKRTLMLAVVFAATFLGIYLYVGLFASLVWGGELFSGFVGVSLGSWIGDVLLFVIIALAGYLVGTQRRARAADRTAIQLERALAEQKADLNAREAEFLRGRLGSHFVMNALSNLVGLMRLGRVEQAEEATILLSDILRSMMSGNPGAATESGTVPGTVIGAGQECVSVDECVADARKYLAFQQIRYPDLQVTYDIAPEAANQSLPRQVLQPLLENTFKHGSNAQRAAIRLSVSVEDAVLRVSVSNKCEAGPVDIATEGEGMTLTRLRLENVFGAACAVERQQNADWYEVVVTVPAALPGIASGPEAVNAAIDSMQASKENSS